VRSYFWPFTGVQNGKKREVMRKMAADLEPRIARMTRIGIVEAAVSAALHQMQASRLPLQLDYFGANEATIFSKHGSRRNRTS
jgi:hypothetical protein